VVDSAIGEQVQRTDRDETETAMGNEDDRDQQTEDDQDQQTSEHGGQDKHDDDDNHQYIDRSKIDFDPDDGLYTGTAVEGTSEIPGPHEKGDDGDGDDRNDGDDDDNDSKGEDQDADE
jgi:hypothetical protein